tara:strand:- start:568 stop:834 length:267 start_codon:yes stop_codon:yes gene_type:complete
MKKKSPRDVLIGPFGESRENAERFGNNLFSCYLLSTTVERMEFSKFQYQKALNGADAVEIERRAIELEAYECSLNISYNLFDDDGYVS